MKILKDEIVVTVIATGFNEAEAPLRPATVHHLVKRNQDNHNKTQQAPAQQPSAKREVKREEPTEHPTRNQIIK